MNKNFVYKPVKELPYDVARKIAAGEVIDRPSAVVRELIDNSIDSGAKKITVEITKGGIESIRVSDNGCGMSKDDLLLCTKTHSTSKISSEEDLLSLNTLGFRGEALSSINAVSRLEITSTQNSKDAWKLSLNKIQNVAHNKGTIVQVDGLFDNFPARKQFLKRPATETTMCRQIFREKALAWPNIEFQFVVDEQLKEILPAREDYLQRTLDCLKPKESKNFFYSIKTSGEGFNCTIILASPEVKRANKKDLMSFVSGRRIYEYSLIHALSYGADGYFPSSTQPFAICFIDIDPKLVDFNIHPAKKEARFSNSSELHHAIHSTVRNFYKNYTILQVKNEESETSIDFDFKENYSYKEKTWDLPKNQNVYERDSFVENKDFYDLENNFHKIENFNNENCHDFKYLGQVLGTFLAVEKNDNFYLIDQHAAHERIIYNSLIQNPIRTQELLVPYRIETSSDEEDKMLEKNQASLQSAGFNLTNEGNGLWHCTSVPVQWKGSQKDLVESILDPVTGGKNIVEALFSKIACIGAAKDGSILDFQAAGAIISATFLLEETICPHGRPVWVKLTKAELFKKVMRT